MHILIRPSHRRWWHTKYSFNKPRLTDKKKCVKFDCMVVSQYRCDRPIDQRKDDTEGPDQVVGSDHVPNGRCAAQWKRRRSADSERAHLPRLSHSLVKTFFIHFMRSFIRRGEYVHWRGGSGARSLRKPPEATRFHRDIDSRNIFLLRLNDRRDLFKYVF